MFKSKKNINLMMNQKTFHVPFGNVIKNLCSEEVDLVAKLTHTNLLSANVIMF